MHFAAEQRHTTRIEMDLSPVCLFFCRTMFVNYTYFLLSCNNARKYYLEHRNSFFATCVCLKRKKYLFTNTTGMNFKNTRSKQLHTFRTCTRTHYSYIAVLQAVSTLYFSKFQWKIVRLLSNTLQNFVHLQAAICNLFIGYNLCHFVGKENVQLKCFHFISVYFTFLCCTLYVVQAVSPTSANLL